MNHSQKQPTNDDLDSLIQRYLDGLATDVEVSQLSNLIEMSESIADRYVRLAHLHSTLVADEVIRANRPSPVGRSTHTPERTRMGRYATFRWIALTATCLLVALVVVVGWQRMPQRFATIRSSQGVVGLSGKTDMGEEWYQLSEGTVELLTALRARIVIEAPARFRFESAQRLRLLYGRLAADVPPSAKGFTVITPTGEAVDLGTKFGVDVPAQGAPEVHVFEGEVVAQQFSGDRRQNLTDGQALRLQVGDRQERNLRSAAFIQPDEVSSLHAALEAGHREQSTRALDELRRDPSLIALLDFESFDLPEGSYRMVQGRWPGSRAPEFTETDDHMRINVGGERDWPQLTMAAWVRIDRLGFPYQSLLHTDGWSPGKLGQVHWMVTHLNTMRLSFRGNTLAPGSVEQDHYPESKRSLLSEQGRWVHLATVYDSEAKTVRFFLNGQFDKETRQSVARPARLGPAQIGNWNEQDRKLSGRVDELILVGRAMSDAEIRNLFEAGNPYCDPPLFAASQAFQHRIVTN